MTAETPKLTAAQVERSFDRFNDYAKALAESSSAAFSQALREFLNFCETDRVFCNIHNQLVRTEDTYNYGEWYAKACEAVYISLPIDEEEQIAFIYNLLRYLDNDPKQILGFILSISRVLGDSERSQSSRYATFSKHFIHRLVRSMTYKLQDIRDALPENPKEVLPLQIFQNFHGVGSLNNQLGVGNGIVQTANIDSSSQLESEFRKLEQLIREHLPSEVQAENLDVVETAKELALANKPSKAKAILNVLKNSIMAIPVIAKGVQDVTASVAAIKSSTEQMAPWFEPITSQILHIKNSL